MWGSTAELDKDNRPSIPTQCWMARSYLMEGFLCFAFRLEGDGSFLLGPPYNVNYDAKEAGTGFVCVKSDYNTRRKYSRYTCLTDALTFSIVCTISFYSHLKTCDRIKWCKRIRPLITVFVINRNHILFLCLERSASWKQLRCYFWSNKWRKPPWFD